MKDSLIFFFNRDLDKLKKELKLYDVEDNIWKISGNISNSAGNLAFHIIGNLNHYIGSEMGNTGYIRNRAAEFSLKGVSRDEILNQIEETKQTISNALLKFPEDWFSRKYPLEEFGYPMTYEYFMVHLVSHLNYHLGQVNYHRRLIESPRLG
ncbi:DinB family protein [Fontibacter flavus]|uniref:DinB family protein n=1 Tax=Fontibacter flavus TaxID=654838 RepID=A0ABV6FTP7_9BACT